MQGSSGTRAGLVYLLAGAALGAAVVLVLWMVSGGRPFGEIVGTTDVSPRTPAATQPSGPQDRAGTPASGDAQLESEPPAIGRSRELRFEKPAAAKAATAKAAKAKAQRKPRPRRKQVVRVVAPPPASPPEEVPVAAVPSPVPTAAPTPPAPAPAGGGSRPVKRAPTYEAGAGEG